MKKLIGKDVYILSNCCDWGDADRNTTIVDVACYSNVCNSVGIVEECASFLVKRYQPAYGWEMWYVHPDCLKLKKEYKAKAQNPYPHTCSYCNSPARKVNSIVFCSNLKCKPARNYIKNIAKICKAKVSKDTDNQGFILCPSCKHRAIQALFDRNFNCSNGHTWTHISKSGDKIDCRDVGYGVFVWNGKWETENLNG